MKIRSSRNKVKILKHALKTLSNLMTIKHIAICKYMLNIGTPFL